MFLAEHVAGQITHPILDAACWMQTPWLTTVLNMFNDITHQVSYCKKLGAQGSVVTAFIHLAAQRQVLHRQGFSS